MSHSYSFGCLYLGIIKVDATAHRAVSQACVLHDVCGTSERASMPQ